MSDIAAVLATGASVPRAGADIAAPDAPDASFAEHIGRAIRSPGAAVPGPPAQAEHADDGANTERAPADTPDDQEFGSDRFAASDREPSGRDDRDNAADRRAHDGLAQLRAFVERVADPRVADPRAAAPDGAVRSAVHAGEPVDVRAMVRDLNALNPELRIRVERVITRMRDEYGHDVRVAETWRSQARQDALYAQGRTREGPVVTWTTHSRHTEGLAADLIVDGTWSDAVAYARLQTVAREEGLRTLGERDRGHVELVAADVRPARRGPGVTSRTQPWTSAAHTIEEASEAAATSSAASAPAGPPAGPMTSIASVARVAAVAAVATAAAPRLATVARVSRAGQTPPPSTAPDRVSADVRADGTRSDAEQNDELGADVPGAAAPTSRGAFAPLLAPASSAPVHNARTSATQLRSTAAERAEQIAAVREFVRAQPMSGLVLRVDSEDGVDDRIRIAVRGTRVDAHIGVGDATRAADLTRRAPELARALEARGFESGSTLVSSALLQRTVEQTVAALSRPMIGPLLDHAGGNVGVNSHARSAQDEQPPGHHEPAFRQRQRRDRSGDTP